MLNIFYECTSLTQLPQSEYLNIIESRAFVGCTGLTSISIPSGIQMGESVFEGCSGLTSGEWSARYIRPGTFLDCTGLTEFTINEGVGEISSDAFSRCRNLAVVRILSTGFLYCIFWGKIVIISDNYRIFAPRNI